MSEGSRRPFPVTIVGRLSIEYNDGQRSGAAEYAITEDRLQKVIDMVTELQLWYPPLQ